MYASLAVAKIEFQADSTTSEDVVITRCLSAAAAAIDAYVGRTFSVPTSATRSFTGHAVNGQVLYLDAPLHTLTAVTNGDGTSVDTSVVKGWPRNLTPMIALELPSTLQWTFDTDTDIQVTGTWGGADTVPADVAEACLKLAHYLYKLKDRPTGEAAGFSEFGQPIFQRGLPNDVRMLLEPYRRRMVSL